MTITTRHHAIAPAKNDKQVATYYMTIGTREVKRTRFLFLMDCVQTSESIAIDVLAVDYASAVKGIRGNSQFDHFSITDWDHESIDF